MTYACPKELCQLFDSCPCNRSIPAQEQSSPDEETGEPLYFAVCQEFGETFCNLRADELKDEAPESKVAEHLPEALDRLYHRMAFVDLANDDSKLRMGLGALSEYVKDCIPKKELRLFGCPLFMRTIYEIGQTKVASVRLAESDEAEGLWTDFKRKLELALSILGKQGLAGTDTMKSWLQDCGDITGRAGSYNAYRRIRHEALDGLLDQCRDIAILNHSKCEEAIKLLYGGIFNDLETLPTFLPCATSVGKKDTDGLAVVGLSNSTGILQRHDTPQGFTKEFDHIATAQADRIIKAMNKGFGTTNSLIKKTWGDSDNSNDSRKPSERRRIDKVIEMYVQKHEIEGKTLCSLMWCCEEVLKAENDAKPSKAEVKSLHNLVNYDKNHFYDMNAIRARLEAKSEG